jgi:hypothetical protein
VGTHRVRRSARVAISLGGVGVIAMVAGSPAFAAGTGYGGSGSTGLPPTGFGSVVTVKTVGTSGGVARAKVSGTSVTVTVLKGSTDRTLEVAITQATTSAVKRDLPAGLKEDRIVTALGVTLRHGASSATTSKGVVVVLKADKIAKGDVVAVYDSETGKFTRVKDVSGQGHLVDIHIRQGEGIVVLAPPKKK